jgi:hypothetical protein
MERDNTRAQRRQSHQPDAEQDDGFMRVGGSGADNVAFRCDAQEQPGGRLTSPRRGSTRGRSSLPTGFFLPRVRGRTTRSDGCGTVRELPTPRP